MKYLCFLLVLIILYYYGFKYYPERYEDKYHYYFSGFIIINFILIYLFTYEKEFIYKLFYNMYSVSKPGVNLVQNEVDQNQLLKTQLANNQMNQCYQCHNPIFQQDLYNYKLQYIVPIQNGGQNNTSNLKIICPSCYSFS